MFRLFSISHCKIVYSPSFRGSVWSVLTQISVSAQFFFIYFQDNVGYLRMTLRKKSVILCVGKGKQLVEKLLRGNFSPAMCWTNTQPAFISVLTLFSIYFTALLYIACGPEIRASAVFSRTHFF